MVTDGAESKERESVAADRYLLSKDENYWRLETTRLAFLQYVNAHLASCIYFEGEIDSKEKACEAMRISLDAWETPDFIRKFGEVRSSFLQGVDYDLVEQWGDYLHGPMYCMETQGQKALFMCEGRVFEAISFGRPWDDMVPIVPDLVLATLLPYEDIIVSDGLLLHHCCEAIGPGVQRVQREFEQGLARGIIQDSSSFASNAREINDLHKRAGLDPTSYFGLCDFVEQINDLTSKTCFPYDVVAGLRSWDAA